MRAAEPQLATMGDLFARHQARISAAIPRPAAPPPPRPVAMRQPTRTSAAPIERRPRGEGYELHVGRTRVVTVTPTDAGFVVNNHEAGHKATVQDARQADALAARIARLAAMPMGKGDE